MRPEFTAVNISHPGNFAAGVEASLRRRFVGGSHRVTRGHVYRGKPGERYPGSVALGFGVPHTLPAGSVPTPYPRTGLPR